MTLSEYTQLKQQIIFNVGKSENHSQLLNKLKEFYTDDIDSERRLEQIITVGQLLKILEFRDVLSEDNIMPLKEIARKLNHDELIRRLSEYETNHVTREYINYYAQKREEPTIKKEITDSCKTNYLEMLNPIKRQRIDNTIIEEIGKYWRDLARNLKIRECTIEEIDTNYQSLTEKASELLNIYYTNKADPQRWFHDLCNALEKARRKDLSKSVQEIMVMNL